MQKNFRISLFLFSFQRLLNSSDYRDELHYEIKTLLVNYESYTNPDHLATNDVSL